MIRILLCLWLGLFVPVGVEAAFNELKFNELVAHVEQDARDFAREVEEMFQDRCVVSTYTQCKEANYDECQTKYPNPQCLGGPNYFLPFCAYGVDDEEGHNSTVHHDCSGLYDFSVSTIRIPATEALSLTRNPGLYEAICSTRGIDAWLQTRRHRDKDYWLDLGIEPRAWYFGSTTGAFRIWPGRQRDQCGAYDPRERPWYVAGGSGPKNVVLIIDSSGSMGANGDRMNVAKKAAQRIVKTLAGADRVAIVSFNDTARVIVDENGWMMRATEDNKKFLDSQINALESAGSTNFADAFKKAFDVFDATLDAEREVSCNSAILFLTDGENKPEFGVSLPEITQLVKNRTETIRSRTGKPVLLFTYSISENNNVHEYPSQLACAVEKGVWTKITDTREIIKALSSYYSLFSLGLGVDANKDFVAWSDPYNFATGNVLGTTVSVPVYDRSRTPHFFLGVVGVDFSLQAIDKALGGDNAEQARTESIDRVVRASDASCPPELDLTKCELQAWSQIFDPEEGPQCNITCSGSDAVNVGFIPCNMSMPYPTELFPNAELVGQSYAQRVCCVEGTTEPSDQCPVQEVKPENEKTGGSGGSNNAAKIAAPIAITGAIVLGVVGFFLIKKLNVKKQRERDPGPTVGRHPNVHIPPPLTPEMVGIACAPSSRSSSPVPLEATNNVPTRISSGTAREDESEAPLEEENPSTQPTLFHPAETGVSSQMEQPNIESPDSRPADRPRAPLFQAETGVSRSTDQHFTSLTDHPRMPSFQAETGVPNDEPDV